jgi:hypothetical protein
MSVSNFKRGSKIFNSMEKIRIARTFQIERSCKLRTCFSNHQMDEKQEQQAEMNV